MPSGTPDRRPRIFNPENVEPDKEPARKPDPPTEVPVPNQPEIDPTMPPEVTPDRTPEIQPDRSPEIIPPGTTPEIPPPQD